MSTRTEGGVPVSLRGKVVLITGARRGIGLAIAARAAQAGAEVIVHAREQAQAEAAARLIAGGLPMREEPARPAPDVAPAQAAPAGAVPVDAAPAHAAPARAVWGDLSTVEGVRAVITAAGEMTGRLDGLVNNAGLAVVQPAEAFSAEDWERQFAVNVRATFFACQAALPYLRRSHGPAIVNISSLHAQTAVPGRAVYAASKAAVDHLTRTLAVEWAPWRIRVNAVAPGFVRTEQVAHLLAREGARIEARTPLGCVAEPDDVAAAVCFLLSPAARHITGTVLRVDGGYLLYGGWEMPQAAQGT